MNTDALARRIADRCLSGVRIGTAAIDLEGLARKMNVHVRNGIDASLGSAGFDVDAMIIRDSDQMMFPLSNGEEPQQQTIFCRPDLMGIPMRFVLAHELAHAVLALPEFREEPLWAREEQVELICNRAAEQILLPDQLLQNICGSGRADLSVETLERLRVQLKTSITLIVKRLGNLTFRGIIRVDEGVLIASGSPARRSKRDYAPRVVTACFPKHLFIPFNKRLATMGLECLEDAYNVAPLYAEQSCRGRMRAWNSTKRQLKEYDVQLRFKCYLSNSGHGHPVRVLIATCRFRDYVDN